MFSVCLSICRSLCPSVSEHVSFTQLYCFVLHTVCVYLMTKNEKKKKISVSASMGTILLSQLTNKILYCVIEISNSCSLAKVSNIIQSSLFGVTRSHKLNHPTKLS